MIVASVMVAVCIAGVIGAIASIAAYDKPHGELGTPMRIPRRSRQTARASRPSRQLRALEAALSQDGSADQPTSCSDPRSHSGSGPRSRQPR